MRKATGIPDEAVPFAIGVPCTCANGYIVVIDGFTKRYACAQSGDLRPRAWHEGFPALVVENHGEKLIVVNTKTGEETHFVGEVLVNCSICSAPTCFQKADHTGLMIPCCDGCELPPRVLAEGTQPGNQSKWVAMTEQISIATARANAAVEVLRCLVQSFEREMSGGYTTSEQQAALRRAKQIVRGEE